MGKTRQDLLALAVGCLLALAILFGAHLGNQQTSTCVQVNDLRNAIVAVLQNGEKGLPESPYFKQYPDQLRAAQQQYQYDLSKLGPKRC